MIDIARRAGVEVTLLALMGDLQVKGARGVTYLCDRSFQEAKDENYDMVVLPGGLPGADHLLASESLELFLHRHDAAGAWLAAICAAPKVLGQHGLLEGESASCYPGNESLLKGAEVVEDYVVVSGRRITSRGVGTAIPFGLKIVEVLVDRATAEDLAQKMVVEQAF